MAPWKIYGFQSWPLCQCYTWCLALWKSDPIQQQKKNRKKDVYDRDGCFFVYFFVSVITELQIIIIPCATSKIFYGGAEAISGETTHEHRTPCSFLIRKW